MIYTRKLFELYPNDRKRSRYFVRDVTAPRFFLHALAEFRKAFEFGEREHMHVALGEIRFLLQRLAHRRRLRMIWLPPLLAVAAGIRGLVPPRRD